MADAESINLLGKDNNSINSLSTSIRTIFYELLYTILIEDNLSITLSCLLTLIQYFQILYFAYHPTLHSTWNQAVISDVTNVFGYAAIIQIYRNNFWIIFVVTFYFGICLVFFFTMLFIFGFFTIKSQKQVSNIVHGILRLFINLLLSILYIPFLYTFLSMLNCKASVNSTGASIQVVSMFSDVQCWQGMHIFHAVCAIIGIIFIILISYTFSYLYFDGIHSDSKSNSKQNSHDALAVKIYETFLIVFYIFIEEQTYVPVLIIIFFVGSIVTFFMVYIKTPFNQPIVQKYQCFFSAINLWTGVMLTMAYLTEKTIFHGNFYAWIIGLILLSFIIFWSPLEGKNRDKGINANLNKFGSSQEIIDHAHYIFRLIKGEQKKTISSMLLNGYIEYHNKTCLNPQCPLKKVKFNISQFKKINAKQQQIQANSNKGDQKMDKRYQLCYEMISRIFENGILQFPTSINLRIQYAVFLMNIIKSKQHALNEIVEAENFQATFDEKFVLYYIKRTIETQISEIGRDNTGNSNADYGEQRNLDGRITHFKQAMEQTVNLLMEFWSQFSDDKPDLIKLTDIGSKLFPLKIMVDDEWKKISRSKGEQLPKILRLYSKYLMDIFNDKSQGLELLDRASKLEINFHQRKDFHLNYQSDINIDGQEEGIVFMTMEEERIGQILAINLSAASMFGYNKTELINKNVTTLQPSNYSKYHDDILKRYLETNETTISNKDKQLFGKSKFGYIFPFTMLIKPVYHALKDGIEFIALMRREKQVRNICYLITNYDGLICDISTSSLTVLGIDLKTITLQQVYITSLFPDYFSAIEDYKVKLGRNIDYTFPKITDDVVQFGKGNLTVQTNVQVIEINFKVKQQCGFIIKVELLQKKVQRLKTPKAQKSANKLQQGNQQQNTSSLNNSQLQQDMIQQQSIFEFKLVVQDTAINYHGEYFEGQLYSEIPNNTFIVEQSDISGGAGAGVQGGPLDTSNYFMNTSSNIVIVKSGKGVKGAEVKDQEKNQENQEKKVENYGLGIKTVRLFNGAFQEVDKDDSEDESIDQSEEEEKKKSSKMKQQQEQQQIEELADQGMHLTKELNEELLRQRESIAVSTLKIFSLFCVVVMICISCIDYGIKYSLQSTQRQLFNHILLYSNRIAEIEICISCVRELTLSPLIRIPQFPDKTGNITVESDETKLKLLLDQAINKVEQLTIEILKQPSQRTGKTNMYFQTGPQEFDINYAVQQFISKAHNILKLPASEITPTQSDVFFIQYNGQNEFILSLLEKYNQLCDDNLDNISEFQSVSVKCLIASIVVMLFFSLTLTILLGKTIFSKQLILSIFLEIPEKTAQYLYSKCETFLSQLSSGDQDEVHTEVDIYIEDKDGLDDQRSSLFGTKKKKFKNADKGGMSFLIKMLIIAVLIEAYFVLNHILGDYQISTISELQLEYNNTALSDSYYSVIMNAQLELPIRPEYPVFQQNSLINMPGLIESLYKVDSIIHEEHNRLTGYHNNSAGYLYAFETIMYNSPCDILASRKKASTNECTSIFSGIITQGMITFGIRFFQMLRYLNERYGVMYNNPNVSFDFSSYNYKYKKLSDVTSEDNFFNLQRMPEVYELFQSQTVYIKESYRYLQEMFNSELQLLLDEYQVQRVLLLVLFIVILLFAAIMCWLPFLSQLNKEIWSTKCLLSFIPVDEMTKIKAVSTFIREVILDRKI